MNGLFDALIGDPVVNKPDQGNNTDNNNQQNQQNQQGQNKHENADTYPNGVPKNLYGDDFYKRYPRKES